MRESVAGVMLAVTAVAAPITMSTSAQGAVPAIHAQNGADNEDTRTANVPGEQSIHDHINMV